MAVVDIAVQTVKPTGVDLTDQGALSTGDTYQFDNDGRTALHFKKSGATNCNVTIVTPGTDADGNAIADKVVVVPATTGDVMIGPLKRGAYNDENGKAKFTLSNVTGLTVAAYRVGD